MSNPVKCPQCVGATADTFDQIHYHSGVNSDREGFIHLAWRGETAQMTPDEARRMARTLFEVAEAAESDSMVVRFLMEKLGLNLQRAVTVVSGLREYRTKGE